MVDQARVDGASGFVSPTVSPGFKVVVLLDICGLSVMMLGNL